MYSEKKDKTKEAIVLGALFHDIGKFYERANENDMSSQTKGMIGHICPFDKIKNCFTHQHVLWTNEFFEKFFPKNENWLMENFIEHIEINPKILMGKPIICGTRITVELIIKLVAQGWKEEDIIKEYPILKKEDISSALFYAEKI